MNDACAGQPDCSSRGFDGSHSGPERRRTTWNIATFVFYQRRSTETLMARARLRGRG